MQRVPLGIRFCPTDLEAFAYLFSKIHVKHLKLLPLDLVQELDVYQFEPCKLPRKEEDEFAYYFTRRAHKSKKKIHRYTRDDKGYWRMSGSTSKTNAGKKNTLVYYLKSEKEKGTKGHKTNWIMHEYELADENIISDRSSRSSSRSIVLCRIYERKEQEEKSSKEKEGQEKEIGEKEDLNNGMDLPGLLRMLGEADSEVLNRVEEEGGLYCDFDNNATLPNSPTDGRGDAAASADSRMNNTQLTRTRNLIQSIDGPRNNVMSMVEENDIDLSLRL
ncbi:NAC domain-containing protein [Heracleum sosnowskyi]|uniref:NAC domain-containing protein n=1 Tax=Heracleum sosnowskyi TaxID=360622 RepID=A0AAD8HHC2_9APIA|nr:NAC domain-containing protein [Heracleum sosnowskyi]